MSTCNQLDLETLGYRLIGFKHHLELCICNDIEGPTPGYHNCHTSKINLSSHFKHDIY